MDFADVRELVRIRHELRRLRQGLNRASGAGQQGEQEQQDQHERDWQCQKARLLLERLRLLAQQDPAEAEAVKAELPRWECSLGL